eukprot:TRINITY_DN31377_c0_g1_i1.p1 TRINITY_DN31377_c0_g1~~TRINITY_DN31377_c0_g1_i1.p1  ORF type:complete len:302 (+),score=89.62 TRINITY_DN31377_c0_g1_i1:73-906(+)
MPPQRGAEQRRRGGPAAAARSRSAPGRSPRPRPAPPGGAALPRPGGARRRSRSVPQLLLQRPEVQRPAGGEGAAPSARLRVSTTSAAPSVPGTAIRPSQCAHPASRRAAELRLALLSVLAEMETAEGTPCPLWRTPADLNRTDLGARAFALQLREAEARQTQLREKLGEAVEQVRSLRSALERRNAEEQELRAVLTEHRRAVLQGAGEPPPPQLSETPPPPPEHSTPPRGGSLTSSTPPPPPTVAKLREERAAATARPYPGGPRGGSSSSVSPPPSA